ncbi:MAG: hypothetical protein WBV22_05485 [Anaerolineaceae bacterium]
MTEFRPDPKFEAEIRDSFAVPETRAEFIDQLKNDLARRTSERTPNRRPAFHLRSAWTVTVIVLAVMLIATLVIGPQKVVAAFRQLLGYIPGVGIIEQGESLRILAEPVTVTRDDITLTVNQAVLTDSGTQIDYSIMGVSLSAYPREESNPGCMKTASLRLPDGSLLASGAGGGTNSQYNFDYPAIPVTINEATFILPCITNTLPGAAPEGWELPLRFIPAPADFKILPVVEVTSSAETPVGTPESEPNAIVTVDQVIETEDGYILLGAVRPLVQPGENLQITGIAILKDADGNKVPYDFPMDVQPLDDPEIFMQGGSNWAIQFKGAGVKFPLTITFSGVVISQIDPQATASLDVNVGMNPQPGQVFELNQAVTMAGKTIYLISVTVERDGYSFRIDPGTELSGVSVQIEGYSPDGGGGGGGGTWGGTFTTSLMYSTLPVGKLTLVFSNPLAAGPTETWKTSWQPETEREFSSNNTGQVCWNADTIGQVPLLPDGLDGKVLFTIVNPELQIVMADLDGEKRQVLARGSARGVLSPDGSHLAYNGDTGLTIVDLVTGTASLIPGQFGRELHWSPDGSRIATINPGGAFGIFVSGIDGVGLTQLTDLGTESIAGWSTDGTEIYYAIPAGTDGFLLRKVAVSNGVSEDLFVLENSSRKAPMPALSPDGKWIAYRASDNSSVYLISSDGGPARLLLSDPGMAVNGIAWEQGGHLLGVSVMTSEYPEGEMLLIAIDGCETYRLPGLSGELDGVFIP